MRFLLCKIGPSGILSSKPVISLSGDLKEHRHSMLMIFLSIYFSFIFTDFFLILILSLAEVYIQSRENEFIYNENTLHTYVISPDIEPEITIQI